MRTGEGKTLDRHAAGVPECAVRATACTWSRSTTTSRSATPNGWARLYNFLGLSVGVNLSQMEHDAKQAAYAADITYGTNNEFGFDYLRDNMVYETDARVQRSPEFRDRR